MATITASLSTRVDARGKSEILLRFVGGRDHIYRLKSSLFITPDRWRNGAVNVPRLPTPEQKELLQLRARLDDLTIYLLERYAEADKTIIDRRWMQRAVDEFHHPTARNGCPPKLLEAFAIFVERSQDRVSAAQLARYRVVMGALARFENYLRATLLVETLGKDDLVGLERFLRDEHQIATSPRWAALYQDGIRPARRGRNVILQYLSVVRTFYHWAQSEGWTSNDPFATYQMESSLYGTPYYLTLEELEQLAAADLSRRPALAVQRDIFIFQCNVGCRVGDLLRFRQSDVTNGVLEYIPGKTRGENPCTVRVPLNATARAIIDKYSDDAYPRLLPFISAQNYNEAIKDAFSLAGLTRPVTVLDPLTRQEVKKPLNEIASSHLARRTFIGNLYKVVKDPNLISAMSGHSEGSKAFARYRTIDDEIKKELVEGLDGKHLGK